MIGQRVVWMRPVSIKPVEYSLDVPCVAVESFIDILEDFRGQLKPGFVEKADSEIIILTPVDPVYRNRLGTLVKRSLGRKKHLLHNVLFAARKNKVHIRKELNIRPQ